VKSGVPIINSTPEQCCNQFFMCYCLRNFHYLLYILARDEVIDEAAGQEGGKKKRNRKRNKAKG